MTQIHIGWVGFQRRQVSMKEFFGFETIFWPMRSRNKALKLLEYLRKLIQSFLYLMRNNPDVVWVQLPQIPLLWAALMYKWLKNRDARVVADCHNSMIQPLWETPWHKIPFGVSMINRCDLVLVHNDAMVMIAREAGIKLDLVRVLEDAPASISIYDDEIKFPDFPRPWFLFPTSFQEDEPIEELFKTAAMVPGSSFLITGDHKKSRYINKMSKIPSNVKFLGYLPVAIFDAYLLACDAIIGLTRFEGVQISVVNEALGIGKPMVLSRTDVLRKLVPKGAIFVDSSNPESIAKGCLEALSKLKILAAESVSLCEERREMWEKNQAKPIRELLSG